MGTLEGGPNIVTDGLVLYLDAANPKSYPGSLTRWVDLSNNGNNGILINGPTFSSNNYGCINFDGINDGINLGSPSSLQFSTKITICVVVQQGSIGSLNTIIGRWGGFANSYAHNYYLYYNSDGRLSFGFKENGTSNYLNSILNFKPNLKQIYHIAITYDTTESKKFYINGVLDTSYFLDQITNQVMTTDPSTIVSISSNLYESAFFSKNTIYSLQMYNRALTENEVKQNFNSVKQRFNL